MTCLVWKKGQALIINQRLQGPNQNIGKSFRASKRFAARKVVEISTA
jgi:hypothetical protein